MRYSTRAVLSPLAFLVCMGLFGGCASMGGSGDDDIIDLSKLIPADAKDILVTRHGKKIPITPGFEYQEGDVIELGEGKFKSPHPIDGVHVRLVGAGPDKTIISGFKKRSTFQVRNGSLAVESVGLYEPYITVGTTASVTFVNVKVEGQPRVSIGGYKAAKHEDFGARVSFFFSEFNEEPKESKESYPDRRNAYSVFYSRYKKGNGFAPYFRQRSSNEYDFDPYIAKWAEQGDLNQLFSAKNTRLFNQDLTKLRIMDGKLVVHNGVKGEVVKLFDRMKRERSKFSDGTAVASENGKTAAQYFAQAIQSEKKGNYFVELVSLMRAQQLGDQKLDSKISQAIKANRVQLSRRYGCWTGFSGVKGRKYGISSFEFLTHYYSEKVKDLSKILVALGSENSRCLLQATANIEHFVGQDTAEKVVSVDQQWKEDPRSRAMREMYQNAAQRAAEDASKSRFNASLGNLTSTAKQLQQNRNKIESKADGLYLVMNNKRVKSTSKADQRAYDSKMGAANQLRAQGDSSGRKMVKNGTIKTSAYFRTYENEIQYDLKLKQGKAEKKYAFPPALKKYSRGPCTVKVDSNSAQFQGLKNLTDTCGPKEYSPDPDFRKAYIDRFLVLPTHEFLLAEVVPSLIREAQKKHDSKSPESNLDGMILTHLMSGSVGDPDFNKKANEVLGEPISMNELRDVVFFYK